MASEFDVCIRGAGIVGRSLALLLARERMRVALVDTAPASSNSGHSDVRAYALNQLSREVLQSVRSWPESSYATPVTRMDVYGDAGGEVHFEASQHNTEALNWIVDLPALEAQLAAAVRYQPMVEVLTSPVDANLTVVCEGKSSRTRAEFGVDFDVTPYTQHAIATRLECEHPHGQVARQWFLPDGILAFLPLDGPEGRSVAVVWSVDREQVAPLLALEPEAFAEQLETASQGALGRLELTSARSSWPLQQAQASRWCGPLPSPGKTPHSWVLAGDAAHNIHPLAGQGLNLGLADAQTLARVLHGRDYWRSVADMRLLRSYERERKAAMLPMSLATDGLQQLFSRTENPLQTLRNWGMRGFERNGLLKNWIVRQAMGTH